MAFMNKETFELCNRIFKDNKPEDFIELDEQIALAISVLNSKGYKTEFCCSGHLSKHEFYSPVRRNGEVLRYIRIGDLNNFAYVQFIDVYEFKTLPKGFILDSSWDNRLRSITCNFKSDIDTLDRLKEISKAMVELTNWAYDLPNFIEEL